MRESELKPKHSLSTIKDISNRYPDHTLETRKRSQSRKHRKSINRSPSSSSFSSDLSESPKAKAKRKRTRSKSLGKKAHKENDKLKHDTHACTKTAKKPKQSEKNDSLAQRLLLDITEKYKGLNAA